MGNALTADSVSALCTGATLHSARLTAPWWQ